MIVIIVIIIVILVIFQAANQNQQTGSVIYPPRHSLTNVIMSHNRWNAAEREKQLRAVKYLWNLRNCAGTSEQVDSVELGVNQKLDDKDLDFTNNEAPNSDTDNELTVDDQPPDLEEMHGSTELLQRKEQQGHDMSTSITQETLGMTISDSSSECKIGAQSLQKIQNSTDNQNSRVVAPKQLWDDDEVEVFEDQEENAPLASSAGSRSSSNVFLTARTHNSPLQTPSRPLIEVIDDSNGVALRNHEVTILASYPTGENQCHRSQAPGHANDSNANSLPIAQCENNDLAWEEDGDQTETEDSDVPEDLDGLSQHGWHTINSNKSNKPSPFRKRETADALSLPSRPLIEVVSSTAVEELD